MTDKGYTEGGGIHNQQMEKFESLNPQGMAVNGLLNIHFEKGFDATENMQRNIIRALERNEKAHYKALSELPIGTDTSMVQHTLDTIDSEITKAALQAEQATATRSFGYAWSPTLAEAGQ